MLCYVCISVAVMGQIRKYSGKIICETVEIDMEVNKKQNGNLFCCKLLLFHSTLLAYLKLEFHTETSSKGSNKLQKK